MNYVALVAILSTPLLAVEEPALKAIAASEVTQEVSTIPESSIALLLGGIFWFILLRKRNA